MGSNPGSGRNCRRGEWITSVLSIFNTTTKVRPLSKASNCSRCVSLGWVKCRAQISLLAIFCIIVYVMNNTSSLFFSKTFEEPVQRSDFCWSQQIQGRLHGSGFKLAVCSSSYRGLRLSPLTHQLLNSCSEFSSVHPLWVLKTLYFR